ncbi:MAG TPA: MFS transporter [Acidimicrobiales bacterium]|nr:MFS transporter [Acidimicrobiales bacterium]
MTRNRQFPDWAVLLVCCAAQFMVVLDFSIVNVALPAMRHSLGLSTTGQQWVVNAYALTFAGFLLWGGRAADLLGRKRVFLTGLGLFTFASLVGGFAQTGAELVGARALQGIGGAVLAPATLSLLTTTYTDTRSRAKALGVWSATAASGGAAGALLGGVLTQLVDWRAVLFVNVPIGIALLALASQALRPAAARAATTVRDLDLAGTLTGTAGLTVLVYGIVSTDTHAWGSAHTVGALLVAAALLATFVAVEARFASNPLMPLRIFANRSLSAANAIAVMVGAVLFGSFFFQSLYLQQVNGYGALRAGLSFLPQALVTLATSLSVARLVRRTGPRRILAVGPLIAAGGLLWLAQLRPGSGYLADVLGPFVLIGVGMGTCFVPMTLAATSDVAPRDQGLASGIVNTSRFVGGALGLAVMSTLATSRATQLLTGRLVAGDGEVSLALRDRALTFGYDRAFLIAAALCVLAAALGNLVPRVLLAARPSPVADPRALDLATAAEPAGELHEAGEAVLVEM